MSLRMAVWASPRKTRYRGILLVQNPCCEVYAAEFLETARAGVDFLAEHDPRRLAHVRARIRTIMNVPLTRLCPATGSMWFDFDDFHAETAEFPQEATLVFAAALSASAAWLRACAAAPRENDANRPRLSNIFLREMQRFLARHAPDSQGHIDWSRLEEQLDDDAATSWLSRLLQLLHRLRAGEAQRS